MVLPLLFAITFAIIDFGRYFYAASTVQEAAQAAVRAGLGEDGIVNLAAATQAAEASLIALKQEDVTILVSQPNPTTVEVAVTYQFEFLTPFLAPLFPDHRLAIHRGASMIVY